MGASNMMGLIAIMILFISDNLDNRYSPLLIFCIVYKENLIWCKRWFLFS